MANTKSQLIVYVERNRLHLVGSSLQSPVVWDIPPNLVSDIEVLNSQGFQDMIKARLLEQKLQPSPLALILSPDIYYEKDIDPLQPPQAFLEAVPFEHLASATFSFEKKSKLIATNQDLLESITHAFESAGFMIAAIVPIFLLKQFGIEPAHGLDAKSGEAMLKNFEALKPYSLFSHHEVFSQQSETTQNTSQPKSGSKRAIILVVIFVVLISILIFMLLQSGKKPV